MLKKSKLKVQKKTIEKKEKWAGYQVNPYCFILNS